MPNPLQPRKFSLDESEALLSVLEHPGFEHVLTTLAWLVESLQDDVIKLDMSGENKERELLYRKCRAEGAAKLLLVFERRLAGLKSRQQAET